jgi:hypothetical protein
VLLAFLALAPAPDGGQGFVSQALYLAAGGVAGGGVFVLVAGSLRVREMGELWQKGRELVRRGMGRSGQ